MLAAVRLARDEGLGVGVMATGHGVAAPCDGGVLINTSRMRGVHVDPETSAARVEAGAKWADLVPEAAAHGLAGLQGSTSHVGVVGYTMGGGFGWLGRKYGFAADSVKEADVVTAEGELVKANAHENADLFWALKGGGGNFGVVTSLEFALYPITHVFGRNLFYPVERAEEVLELYSGWAEDLPEEVTSAVTFLNVPPIPDVPEPLRGRSVITVRFCYTGEDLAEKGEELLGPWRGFGEPVMDTFGVMPYEAMDMISMDPVEPLGAYGHSEMLRDLSRETRQTLMELAGAGSDTPLLMLEIRQLGGALSRPPADLSPMGRSDATYAMNGIGGHLHPRDGSSRAGVPRPLRRGVQAACDRRHLRELHGPRRREPRAREGGLLRGGLGAAGGAEGPPRSGEPLPIQPQHPAVFGRARERYSVHDPRNLTSSVRAARSGMKCLPSEPSARGRLNWPRARSR